MNVENLRADVHSAIKSRRSIRRFLPTEVPQEILEKILIGAGYAPSGHNSQPWKVYIIRGETKQRVTDGILKAIATEPEEDHQPEYDYYPTEWFDPYLTRRRKVGHDLYELLGIERSDKAAREKQMAENFSFFGAPVGMFVTFDRRLATGTFMDIGMFLQSIFIGARGEGLDTCGQAVFTWYHKVIREILPMEENELLACGLSLGYIDPAAPENRLFAEKLELSDYCVFLD
ncbi:nitroreductase [Sneathiella chungangensis]|uniref:Nitroreductase n=1 Tax=Sneathiella chungangensis TaxID=1418234 RepID=A0A845MGU0_9PROT|nr:nitroreductase [Sneathiella chungangensis]MZR23228.1 nitroreductase [Sneathiella chungangensis]